MHHQHHLAGAMSDDALHDTSTSTLGPARGGAGAAPRFLGIFLGAIIHLLLSQCLTLAGLHRRFWILGRAE